MKTFFGIAILIGIILASVRTNDIWFEDILSGWRGRGVLTAVAGVIGEICVWCFP